MADAPSLNSDSVMNHSTGREERQPQPPEDGEPGASAAAGTAGSPRTVLGRLRTRFQQSSEDLLAAQEQNLELEKRITSLTEQILAANEEKESQKTEHRAALSRLEEAALAERRRYENSLCSARQQQQRGQMDLRLATDELAAVRGQLKALQMEKVSLARRVRDLETEVKARCRLQQNAFDQMVRYNQAKNKLDKEVAGLVEWLKRLEAESRSAAELNRRLQLLLQHQNLQLEQLAPVAAAGRGSDTTCPELDQLGKLLVAGAGRIGGTGDGLTPPPPAGAPDSHGPAEAECGPAGSPLGRDTPDSRPAAAAAAASEYGGASRGVHWSGEGFADSEAAVAPLLLAVPRLDKGGSV